MQASNRRIQDDLARVARERDDAIRELQYLKRQVNERNQNNSDIEEQLDRSRQVCLAFSLTIFSFSVLIEKNGRRTGATSLK